MSLCKAALAGLLLATLCAHPSAAENDGASGAWQLRLTGSSTMAPLLTEIAKRFQSLHPGVTIEVQGGGSGRGVADVTQGKSDIGMVSRTLGDSERALYAFPIARDGVAVIVHRDNPVQALGDRQIRDIYSGRVSNWKQVGGRDAPIAVLASDPHRGSTELFLHYLGIAYGDIRVQRLVGDNALRIGAVAESRDAIVYVSVGEAERRARAGTPIKLLPIGGIAATSQLVRKGEYPLARPLALVSREMPRGLAKSFVEFALSSLVTDLIVAYEFVPYLD